MASLRDFASLVQPVVRLCPAGVTANAVRSAAIEFCRRSQLWRDTLTGDIVAGNRLVSPATPVDAVVTAAFGVWAYGQELSSLVGARANAPGETGNPGFWSVSASGQIELFPAPKESSLGGLVVDAVLAPSRNAASLPDFLYNTYADAISFGAIGEVAGMVGQPWANPQVALYNAGRFKKEIARARISELRGRGQESLIVIS